MLRLIGAIIVALLILAPVLLRAGISDHMGFLEEFVDLETRVFVYLADVFRSLWDRYA
jgi:hypothetical protein